MAQIITKISFQNFYNYYGSYAQNSYDFTFGLNLVVADNGGGKSKFFNGLTWILTDTVFDSDKKMKVPIDASKFLLISDKAKIETLVGGTITAGVRLHYRDTSKKLDYEITKELRAKRVRAESPMLESSWEINTNQLSVSRKDVLNFKPIYDEEDKVDVIRKLISPEFRRYALVQGEEVDDIVNLHDSVNLTETIKVLTDISRFERLEQYVKYVCEKAKKDYDNALRAANKNNTELDEKISLRQTIEVKVARAEEERNGLANALATEEDLKANLLNSYGDAQKRKEYREAQEQLKVRYTELLEEEDKFINSINAKLFNRDFCWLLVGTGPLGEKFPAIRDRYLDVQSDAIAEARVEEKLKTRLPIDSPDNTSLAKMLKEEKCFVCGRPAKKNSEEWLSIKGVLDDHTKESSTRGKIFKQELREFMDRLHTSYASLSPKLAEIDSSVSEAQAKLEAFRKKKIDLDKKREDVLKEFLALGGTQDTNQAYTDSNIFAEFTNVSERANRLTSQITALKVNIEKWRAEISMLEREIEGLKGGDSGASAHMRNRNSAEALTMAISNTRERIFKDTMQMLENEANIHFKRLTMYNEISGGDLKLGQKENNRVSLVSVDPNGNTLSGLSEGFQRMRKLAVIIAIISTSNKNRKKFIYPFVADAPLSSFGVGFVKGFFEEFRSEGFPFPQSIILVKDLYDRTSSTKLSPYGAELLNELRAGSIYVNEVEEGIPQTERTTKILKYVFKEP
jgi:DNA sulfur modification protein DndD